jgi:hypothetical protein
MIETIYYVGTCNPTTGEKETRLISADSVTQAACRVAEDLEAEAIEEVSMYPSEMPMGSWRIESCEKAGILVTDDVMELL